MEDLNVINLLIEFGYSALWILFFVLIFHPRWAEEKEYQYKSRKFRLSVVFFGVATAFFALEKIESVSTYIYFLLVLFSVALGVNVIQKYIEGTTSLVQYKNGDSNSGKENTDNS